MTIHYSLSDSSSTILQPSISSIGCERRSILPNFHSNSKICKSCQTCFFAKIKPEYTSANLDYSKSCVNKQTLESSVIHPSLLVTKHSRKLAHSLLLAVRNENQSGRSILGVRHIAAVETTSLQLNNLVLLQSLASIVHNHSVLGVRCFIDW